MEQLRTILSALLPEWRFKDSLRCLFYSMTNRLNIVMEKRADGFQITTPENDRFLICGIPAYEVGMDLRVLAGYLQKYKPQKGDVVIDAGASGGVLTIYFALKVGQSGRVFAFEPNTGYREKLESNLRLNGIKNVTVVSKGLWNKEEILLFTDAGDASVISPQGGSKVECTDLDSFLEITGLKRVDFVKMDIEGAELEAVAGMSETMRRFHPSIAIASYHMRNGSQTCHAVENLLASHYENVGTGFPEHLTTHADRSNNAISKTREI